MKPWTRYDEESFGRGTLHESMSMACLVLVSTRALNDIAIYPPPCIYLRFKATLLHGREKAFIRDDVDRVFVWSTTCSSLGTPDSRRWSTRGVLDNIRCHGHCCFIADDGIEWVCFGFYYSFPHYTYRRACMRLQCSVCQDEGGKRRDDTLHAVSSTHSDKYIWDINPVARTSPDRGASTDAATSELYLIWRDVSHLHIVKPDLHVPGNFFESFFPKVFLVHYISDVLKVKLARPRPADPRGQGMAFCGGYAGQSWPKAVQNNRSKHVRKTPCEQNYLIHLTQVEVLNENSHWQKCVLFAGYRDAFLYGFSLVYNQRQFEIK